MDYAIEKETDMVREARAMLAVSNAVAQGSALGPLLDQIAAEAAAVVGANRASILLMRTDQRFEMVGNFGLSSRYQDALNGELMISHGHGPSGQAVATGKPIVTADLSTDPEFGRWNALAAGEGVRGFVSVPMLADPPLGALNAHWSEPGTPSARHVELLSFFAEHALSAIRSAQLMERQRAEMAVLTRLVDGLREQTHEYANRIHAVSGLLALDDVPAARRFMADLERIYHERHDAIAARISVRTLAGLVIAENAIAAQRGVGFELGEDSSLAALPTGLDELGAVTLVGNLLRNAVEAVAGLPQHRKWVRLDLLEDRDRLTIAVSDGGVELPEDIRERMFAAGTSTKAGHEGLGLALASRAVTAARGETLVQSTSEGTVISVVFPNHGQVAHTDR